MTLRATINDLAERFAHDLLRALRSASLEEIISETRGHATVKRTRTASFVATSRQSGRRKRSPEELQSFVDRIVATVATHRDGIRAEDLKRAMGVAPGNRGAKKFTGPIAMALKSKKIRKSGARRGTTYHAT